MFSDLLESTESTTRTVGLLSSLVPRELLVALDCRPVRVFPVAAKPTAAEAYLPRNFCSLSRLLLSGFLEETDAPRLDAVVFTDEDDATRRLHDVWPTCVRVPVWGFLEVPRGAGALAASRFAALLAVFARNLEVHTGQALYTRRLRAAIGLFNEQRALLARLKQTWLAGCLPTPTYRRLRRSALTEPPLIANAALRRQLDEGGLETGATLPSSDVGPSPLRLLLLAELAAPSSLVRQLEAAGAHVVGEDSGLDELAVADSVPDAGETIEQLLAGLARAYLNQPPAPRTRDLPRRLAHITGLVRERRANAAICAYSKFCDLPLAEYPILRTELERMGVPTLLLELEDDALSGQHRTRVEAFLEMVRAR
jgi:benzoyl-CoA reductase subunit C